MMRAPRFWRYDGFIAELLVPFSVFFYLYTVIRKSLTTATSFNAKIICVGNAVAGGAGKTPTALAIAKILKSKKKKFAFVSRGYGGYLKGPVKVNTKKHTSNDVGDEPLLLAKVGPCWVGKNRKETIKAAVKSGAKYIILDDGYQDPSIKKDISLLVIDGLYGFGNGFLIPAGPLRGKLADAIKDSDCVLLVGQDKTDVKSILKKYKAKILNAKIVPKKKLAKGSYIAFCGIGNPEKFSTTLEEMKGVKIVSAIDYSDHYAYSDKDISELIKLAKDKKARLVTTEKDAVKISPEQLKHIDVVQAEIVFEDNTKLTRILKL